MLKDGHLIVNDDDDLKSVFHFMPLNGIHHKVCVCPWNKLFHNLVRYNSKNY